MKNRYLLVLGTAIAAALALPSMSLSSRAEDVANIPTPEEARAALLAPISRQPSTGDALATTIGAGDRDANAGSQPSPDGNASAEPPPSGPIGSFGQTIPAKFSKRNEIGRASCRERV